jgi:[methyl-Co(III) methanol-specific corrinoid protein]:coenzyme M methyltransferase
MSPVTSRDDTLGLLSGRRLQRLPVFGGLPSVTATGLEVSGLRYAEAHTDPDRMAAAAASTWEVFGYESAVAPLDMCVEAEALGAAVDFQADVPGFLAPVVRQPAPFQAPIPATPEVLRLGRLPLVARALRRLKAGVGRHVAVAAWVPGPFTLGWQLYGATAWMGALVEGQGFAERLAQLAALVAPVGQHYREAGADFVTIHEMGGSPQVVGPRTFRAFVLPALRQLIAALPPPVVLSVCGDTNRAVDELAACGAAALNVDHRNRLADTRRRLGAGPILLGNFDPVGLLSHGTPEAIAAAIRELAAAGVDAFWPGCDLWPDIPEANFRALMGAAQASRRPAP